MKRVLKHGRTLRLDPGSLSSAMNRCGMSVEELAYATDTSTGSVNNWLSGKPAYRSTAQRVADALQTNLVALLEPVAQLSAAQAIHEYVLAEILTDWKTTSNGLRYQICRLRHSELDRQARGKGLICVSCLLMSHNSMKPGSNGIRTCAILSVNT